VHISQRTKTLHQIVEESAASIGRNRVNGKERKKKREVKRKETRRMMKFVPTIDIIIGLRRGARHHDQERRARQKAITPAILELVCRKLNRIRFADHMVNYKKHRRLHDTTGHVRLLSRPKSSIYDKHAAIQKKTETVSGQCSTKRSTETVCWSCSCKKSLRTRSNRMRKHFEKSDGCKNLAGRLVACSSQICKRAKSQQPLRQQKPVSAHALS